MKIISIGERKYWDLIDGKSRQWNLQLANGKASYIFADEENPMKALEQLQKEIGGGDDSPMRSELLEKLEQVKAAVNSDDASAVMVRAIDLGLMVQWA